MHYKNNHPTLKEYMQHLNWYFHHLFNWHDWEHERFLERKAAQWALLSPNHARLWQLYQSSVEEPVRFWAAMAWAYGWKNVTLKDIEIMMKEETKYWKTFDKGVEAYEATLYFEADVDATRAVDRDVEAYRATLEEEALIEEYENQEYIDTDGALLKTYWA